MRIEKILYQKIFPTGMAYLNHKIGVEIMLDAPGDDPDEIFKEAKSLVERWNIESNPGMAAAMEYMNIPELSSGKNGSQPTTRDTVDNIIAAINSSKNLVTLKWLEPTGENAMNERIMNAYNEKLKSFQ